MLLKLILVILCCSQLTAVFSQKKWQQQVDHTIEVELDPVTRTLDARQQIMYRNNSRDTLSFIYFHIWPNAYKNDHTAFSEQLLINNRLDFYFSKESERGYINRLVFSANNESMEWVEDSLHQDFGKLLLTDPLLPGDSILLLNSFHVQLPSLFSRSGYKNDFFAVTQWYPKPAVYDSEGWHPMPYLDQGEYYNEFGNYDVTIVVPSQYKIAASGERSQYRSFDENGITKYATRFTLSNSTDFAWFGSPFFTIVTNSLRLPSGKNIELEAAVLNSNVSYWEKSLDYLREALLTRSMWLGDYPYNKMTIVDGFQGPGSGGMEYPAITVLNEIKDPVELDMIIAHETGHNWFSISLANNERTAPWQDEGVNAYYDQRYRKLRYPALLANNRFPANRLPANQSLAFIRGVESIREDQSPLEMSDQLRALNYGLMVYEKTALQLEALEKQIGQAAFDSAMRAYVQENQFSHVDMETWKQYFPFNNAVPDARSVDSVQQRRLQPVFLFSSRQPEKYHYLGIGPAVGFNQYDGLQLGIFVHNYQLPLPRFRFFFAPTVGTNSGNIGGIARFSHHWYPQNKTGSHFLKLKEWSIGADLLRITADDFKVDATALQFSSTKFAPYVKLNFATASPLSKKESFVQFKSFLFMEDFLSSEKIINGQDTGYIDKSVQRQRGLQQLRIYHGNHRVLYPYELEGRIESNTDFTRIAVTTCYFLNYPNLQGGLQIRFFGGKFLTHGSNTVEKKISNNRYYLNMTGASGQEDYTYSNYFAGRNEFSGWMSQQIMIRDGGFKVRTSLLGNKIGRSANWLTALNFTADVPSSINPLSKLPIKIPLKLFLDIGTYAEAWEEDRDQSTFLMDAGLQLSLFRNLVNVYIPVVNSKVFRDYHQSTLGDKKLLKSISFSIDIHQVSSKKWLAKQGL